VFVEFLSNGRKKKVKKKNQRKRREKKRNGKKCRRKGMARGRRRRKELTKVRKGQWHKHRDIAQLSCLMTKNLSILSLFPTGKNGQLRKTHGHQIT